MHQDLVFDECTALEEFNEPCIPIEGQIYLTADGHVPTSFNRSSPVSGNGADILWPIPDETETWRIEAFSSLSIVYPVVVTFSKQD